MVISTPPTFEKSTDAGDAFEAVPIEWDWVSWSYNRNLPLREFLLVWDWSTGNDTDLILPHADYSYFDVYSKSPSLHASDLSVSHLGEATCLINAAMVKEQCGFSKQAKSNITHAFAILKNNEAGTTTDRLLRDLNVIHELDDSRPREVHYTSDYNHTWKKIIQVLENDFKVACTKQTAKQSEVLRILVAYHTPSSVDILDYIRNNIEQCLLKLSVMFPEGVEVLFMLFGDMIPLSTKISNAITRNPKALTIFWIVIDIWNRDREIQITYDMLQWAVRSFDPKLLLLLVEQWPEQVKHLALTTNICNFTAIADSLRDGYMLSMLLDSTASIDLTTLSKTVALYRRAYALDTNAIHELIADKINVDIRDKEYETILLKASRAGREDLVKVLLETSKVNIECQDIRGNTPLYYAVNIRPYTMCKLLLDHGANPDIANKYNETPRTKASWVSIYSDHSFEIEPDDDHFSLCTDIELDINLYNIFSTTSHEDGSPNSPQYTITLDPAANELSSDACIELSEPEWSDEDLMDDARPGRRKSAREMEGGQAWDWVKRACAVDSVEAGSQVVNKVTGESNVTDHNAVLRSHLA
ncbi:hypothetical protein N0V90_008031 [Kalmusia sp. IMI 367209]|nr:hypothetical protein N0V90_008031 [Kalmusia sp. IMI 367209]